MSQSGNGLAGAVARLVSHDQGKPCHSAGEWLLPARLGRKVTGGAARLSIAYTVGRLSKDEYDARLESALVARTYADLDQVVTGLPTAQTALASPAAKSRHAAIRDREYEAA
jgi:Domain of unknown function (DUF1707)